jgi:putative FmdB family regulatory protein
MPIYEYRCEDCGTRFEKLVRGGTEVECPQCGQKRLKQELSTFAAHASSGAKPSGQPPMCPSGGPCNPGMCGMNFN